MQFGMIEALPSMYLHTLLDLQDSRLVWNLSMACLVLTMVDTYICHDAGLVERGQVRTHNRIQVDQIRSNCRIRSTDRLQ